MVLGTLTFSLYIPSRQSLAHFHGFDYHVHPDDSPMQLPVQTSTSSSQSTYLTAYFASLLNVSQAPKIRQVLTNSRSAALKPDPLPIFLISGNGTTQSFKAKSRNHLWHFPVPHHHAQPNHHRILFILPPKYLSRQLTLHHRHQYHTNSPCHNLSVIQS